MAEKLILQELESFLNLKKEVIEMLLEDGEPQLEDEFVATQNVVVA